MDPVRKSDRIDLLFTGDRSGTGPERIQNWTCSFTGPILDPFGSVPDRFQNVPCKQKPIRSGPVRFGMVSIRSRVNVTDSDKHVTLCHCTVGMAAIFAPISSVSRDRKLALKCLPNNDDVLQQTLNKRKLQVYEIFVRYLNLLVWLEHCNE